MLKVISPNKNWILGRCAKELKGLKTKKDISYFINYACYKETEDIKVALFTHREERGVYHKMFEDVARKVDLCISMCDNTTRELMECGIPYNKIKKVYMGSDDRLENLITFGVVGRVYGSGRKGENMVTKLIEDEVNVIAHGKGWDCPIFSDRYEDIPEFFKEIDYLIVPSLNEGGPIPVIDAIRAGVPVIAPDVGFSWEFPVIKYVKGDYIDLKSVIDRLTKPPTWKQWRDEHKKLLEKL